MDFFSVVFLIAGVFLPLLATFLIVRRGWRQFAVAQAYGEVSRGLKLPVDTRGLSLHGHLDGSRIWVGEVMVGHGTARKHVCLAVLDFHTPLGLGLLLRRRGLSERVFRRGRSPEVQIDADFERSMEVHGDHPDPLRALLTPAIRAQLIDLVKRWRDVVVTDRSVRIHLDRPPGSAAELHRLVGALQGFVRAVDAQRAQVDPPKQAAERTNLWPVVAAALGLTFEPNYPRIVGTLHGVRVQLSAIRNSRGYAGELRVTFPDHRATGLQLHPQTRPDGYWSVGQDIQIADEEFDAAFVIKGWDPMSVVEQLDGPVRRVLLQLLAHGPVYCDDDHLELRPFALDCDAAELLELAATVPRLLGWQPPAETQQAATL